MDPSGGTPVPPIATAGTSKLLGSIFTRPSMADSYLQVLIALPSTNPSWNILTNLEQLPRNSARPEWKNTKEVKDC